MKGVFGNALELGEPDFCQSPKAFDAVDMGWAIDELVPGMIYPIMTIAYIDQSVKVGANHRRLMMEDGSTLPRIIPCNVGMEQSGTISV